MIKKIIPAVLALIITSSAFFIVTSSDSRAFEVPKIPTNTVVAPDYTDFGSSLGGSASGIGLGAVGCFAGALIGGLFGGSFDINYCIDNFIIRPVMRTIENAIENNLLNQISAVVTDKAGRGQDPHFITDWRNTTLNSAGRGTDIFRAILADTELCPHFGDNIKGIWSADLYGGFLQGGSLTNPPGTEDFQFASRCTLNFNVDNFKQDFTQGGWTAWLELIQPNNNFFGVFGAALQEEQAQVFIEQKSTSDENIANEGSLPSRAGIGGNAASGCAVQGLTRCIFQARIITPGKLFGDATAKIFDQKFETIGGAREIQDLILALTDAVINKLSGRLDNFLGSGSSSSTAPVPTILPRAICLANCQIAPYPQCTLISPAPAPTTQSACIQNAIAVCQAQCP